MTPRVRAKALMTLRDVRVVGGLSSRMVKRRKVWSVKAWSERSIEEEEGRDE